MLWDTAARNRPNKGRLEPLAAPAHALEVLTFRSDACGCGAFHMLYRMLSLYGALLLPIGCLVPALSSMLRCCGGSVST